MSSLLHNVMSSPEDIAFQNRMREMQRRENALRNEQWGIQQKEEGHAKCLSNPRTCGSGIWRAGIRMSKWHEGQRQVARGEENTAASRNFNRDGKTGRGRLGVHDDSTKTHKEMTIMLFGKEKWDREQRSAKISGELKTLKTDHEKMLKAENARKVAKLKREHEKHRATIAANIKKAKRKANHPQNTTIRSPARRHKTGARSRYVPPPRGRSRR